MTRTEQILLDTIKNYDSKTSSELQYLTQLSSYRLFPALQTLVNAQLIERLEIRSTKNNKRKFVYRIPRHGNSNSP